MRDKEIIKSIHYLEVEALLTNLNILDEYKNNTIKCFSCGVVINKDNFKAIGRIDKNIVITCDKDDCFNFFLQKMETNK